MQALGVDIQTIQSIVGHADTEMTEHYLHVQESIRQSAIQLFSEAFSAWKLDGTALIRPDKIFGIVVKIVVKTKWGQPINKKIQRFLTWNRWIYGPSGENRTHGLLNPIQARYQNCATPGHHPLPPYRSTGDMRYYTRIRQSCQQIFAIFLDFFEESMILTVMRCFASY